MADNIIEKCPFEERDCLEARSLLFQAVKLLDQVLQAKSNMNTIEAFLGKAKVKPLADLARTGKLTLPPEVFL